MRIHIPAFLDRLGISRDKIKFRSDKIGYCGGAATLLHFDEMVRGGEIKTGELAVVHAVESSKWMTAVSQSDGRPSTTCRLKPISLSHCAPSFTRLALFAGRSWHRPITLLLAGELPFHRIDFSIEVRTFWLSFMRLCGMAVFTGGFVAYALCSAWLIFHGRGPHVEFDPPKIFVASGPYRWCAIPS